MIIPRYVPGEWFAAVADGTIGLLPPTASPELVARLWASLRDEAGLGEQLQVLVRDGLTALPPFALVRLGEGRVQTVVRGDVVVEVGTPSGPRVLSGRDVTTWSEATVTEATSVTVRPGDERRHDTGGLPVLSAVVRAAGVSVRLVRATASATAPAPDAADAPAAPAPDAADAPAAPAVRRRDQRSTTPAGGVPVVDVRPETAPEPALVEHVPANGLLATPVHVATHGESDDAPHDVPRSGTPTDVDVEPALADAPRGDEDGVDHDGLTVLSSDVVALRRQLPEWAGDAVPGPLAVPAPEAPPVAKILLSSGLVISLNRPVLLGRAPQVSRVTNSRLPRLVTVASPNQDISRTHAEVRQEGEHVLVTDLRSTNGVLLLRQGHGPQRLHPGEPTVVEPGVVVDLGEGVTFTVEHG